MCYHKKGDTAVIPFGPKKACSEVWAEKTHRQHRKQTFPSPAHLVGNGESTMQRDESTLDCFSWSELWITFWTFPLGGRDVG